MIQDRVEAVMSEGEVFAGLAAGRPARLLREIPMGWWELIGATDLGGIPKVMIAEAHNFPRGGALLQRGCDLARARGGGQRAETGIERGLFRVVDVPATVQVLMAPLDHASVWRNSMAVCDPAAPARGLSASLFRCRFQGLLTGPDSGVSP